MIRNFVVVEFEPYDPKYCLLGRQVLVEIDDESLHMRPSWRVPLIKLRIDRDQYL